MTSRTNYSDRLAWSDGGLDRKRVELVYGFPDGEALPNYCCTNIGRSRNVFQVVSDLYDFYRISLIAHQLAIASTLAR